MESNTACLEHSQDPTPDLSGYRPIARPGFATDFTCRRGNWDSQRLRRTFRLLRG
jgi:hypothetical protein